ncbi:hypothetical protein, partial [Flavobacterium sp.]|uniref:hypothetical protein n=1 Tax=Flavobacterium sp. TaxID=239 RepID=UPI00262A89D5
RKRNYRLDCTIEENNDKKIPKIRPYKVIMKVKGNTNLRYEDRDCPNKVVSAEPNDGVFLRV